MEIAGYDFNVTSVWAALQFDMAHPLGRRPGYHQRQRRHRLIRHKADTLRKYAGDVGGGWGQGIGPQWPVDAARCGASTRQAATEARSRAEAV